jgi:tyrosyl-tRNA synthetase (EC 6.1.1.1)
VEYNPVLELIHIAAFREERKTPFVVRRPPQYGGDVEVWRYEELEAMYREGKIHPADLKSAAAEALTQLLEPVYRYFQGPGAKLLEEMKNISITR